MSTTSPEQLPPPGPEERIAAGALLPVEVYVRLAMAAHRLGIPEELLLGQLAESAAKKLEL